MANFSTKLNLAGLKHSRKLMKGQSGDIDCLIIPIHENKLFIGEKGLYLDLSHIEVKNPAPGSKDTHLVKQSFPKEFYDSLTEEQRKAYPVLGNSIVWNGSKSEPELTTPLAESDDLPF